MFQVELTSAKKHSTCFSKGKDAIEINLRHLTAIKSVMARHPKARTQTEGALEQNSEENVRP